MPNYIRWREAGATYFFTVVTRRRRPILTTDLARHRLREAIQHTQRQAPFDVLASVLLPDHLHCIWTLPRRDDDFPLRWRLIKTRFTQAYIRAGGAEAPVTADHARQQRRGVWQPRYWEHRIRNDDDFIQHRDYIHLNPVKHGYVRTPEEWPWSSVHDHLRDGRLPPDWWSSTRIILPDVRE